MINKFFTSKTQLEKVGWMTSKKFAEFLRSKISASNPAIFYIQPCLNGPVTLSMSFPCVDIQFAYARPDYCFLLKGQVDSSYINARHADRTVSKYLCGKDTMYHFSAGGMEFWVGVN